MGSSILVRKVLRAQPAIDMAFDTTSLICLIQVRSLDMYRHLGSNRVFFYKKNTSTITNNDILMIFFLNFP